MKLISHNGMRTNLENPRIIEEDYNENEFDSLMPRLEENKSSQSDSMSSKSANFFHQSEEEGSNTPHFIQILKKNKIVKKMDENNVC